MAILKDVLVYSDADLSGSFSVGGTFTLIGEPDLMAFQDDEGETLPSDFGPTDPNQRLYGNLEGLQINGNTASGAIFEFEVAYLVEDSAGNQFSIYYITNAHTGRTETGFVSEVTLDPNETYTVIEIDTSVNNPAGDSATYAAEPVFDDLAGQVDGTSGDDAIGPGYFDDDGDAIDGTDGVVDYVLGRAGGDTINAGDGNDVIYGDEQAELAAGETEYYVEGYIRDYNFELESGGFAGIPTAGSTTFSTNGDPIEIRIIDNDSLLNGDDSTSETPDDADQLIEINGVQYRFAVEGIYEFSGSDGNTYEFYVLDVDRNQNGTFDDYDPTTDPGDSFYEDGQILLPVGSPPPSGTTLTATGTWSTVGSIDYTALYGGQEITNYDDIIDGGAGDDSIIAGDGDDTILLNDGFGNDTIDGGEAGETNGDTLDASGLTSGIDVVYTSADGEDGTATAGADVATFSNIENVVYTDQRDTVEASAVTVDMSISTDGGNDVVWAGQGDDVIFGGTGDDALRGQSGDDTVLGEEGNDVLYGQVGNDSLDGGVGDDLLYGGDGSDTLVGGAGIDDLDAGSGDDLVDPGDGNDRIFLYEGGNNVVLASSGDDNTRINMEATGTHTITGGETGETNGDTVRLAGSLDTTVTYSGDEAATFSTTAASGSFSEIENIETDAGNDTIDGSADSAGFSAITWAGEDSVIGGSGDDEIWLGSGNDTVQGGAGSDQIQGESGDDSLDGGAGNDFVCGGDGNDTISGGESTGTPLPDEPTSPTEHQFTIIDPDAFTSLNASNLYFPGWEGEYQGSTSTVQTITVSDLGDPTKSGLAAVENNSAIGPDTDLTLERVATSVDQALNDNDGGGGSAAGQTLVTGFTSPTYGTISAGSQIFTTTEHRFEEYDENGNYIDDFYVFEVTIGTGGSTEKLLVTSKELVDGHTYLSTSRAGAGTVAYDELATFSADPLILGDDTLCGGDGDDTFLVVEGNDTITDFNLGNTGSINDGDQTNNDFVDLSSYYSLDNYNAAVAAGDIDPAVIRNPLEWMRADQDDDGILNDTNAGWDAENTLTIKNGGGAVDSSNLTFDNTNVICFARGTLIATERGTIPVETLKIGDRVITCDNAYQTIRWIGAKRVPALGKLAPVMIKKGVLGNERDLIVSPNHRILVRSAAAQLWTGESENLIPAKYLLSDPNVCKIEGGEVQYFHILFDNHEIILSEGVWTESFHPGRMGWSALCEDSRNEILQLFPEIGDRFSQVNLQTARHVLDKRQAEVISQSPMSSI